MDWIEYSLVALLVLHVVQLFLIHRLRRVIAIERMVTNQKISNLAGICKSDEKPEPVVKSTEYPTGPWVNMTDKEPPIFTSIIVQNTGDDISLTVLTNRDHIKWIKRWAKINV